MKKITLLIILVVLLASYSYTQNLSKSGTTAAQYLKIGIGTRAIGMGGAYTANANDVSSVYWNPAGIAKIYSREAQFNHVDWLMDLNYDFAAFAMGVDGLGSIGAFVSVLSMDEMMVRTIDKPEGTGEFFNAGAMQMGLTFARELTDNFSIGFNVKYLREHIWHMSATGFALDVGTLYRIQLPWELRLGASITNFGTKMKLDGRDIYKVVAVGPGGSQANLINTAVEMESYDLPLMFRIGVAADVYNDQTHRFTLGLDALHPNDNSESVNTGFEYSWNNIIAVRAGYKALFEREGQQGLTLGMGLNYRLIESIHLMLDYAYEDFGKLKNVHYLTVGVKF